MSGQCREELAALDRESVGHSKAEMLACSVGAGPHTCGVVPALNKCKFPLLPDLHGEGRGHLTDRHCCCLFIRKFAEDSGMSLLLSDLTIGCGLLLFDVYYHEEVQRK